MRQYLDIKHRYADAIVMFRLGDFYELFFEDAITVGPVLDITVTTRDKNAADPVPMAGVPYHAIGGYLRTLVEQGFKVAICEQMESPEEARKRKGPNKIVRREVVRVVTPGALLDEEHLDGARANYFVTIVPEQEGATQPGACALAALDISCGEFIIERIAHGDQLRSELVRLETREILAPSSLHGWLKAELGREGPSLDGMDYEVTAAQLRRAKALFAECNGGAKLDELEVVAAGRALAYAEHTQPSKSLLIHRLRRHTPGQHLVLDDNTLRNLEIFRTLRDGKPKGSLMWAIDGTKTAMGARLLRSWLGAPLGDRDAIARRLDGVQALVSAPDIRASLQSRLKDVRDVVRLAARARLSAINPRELGALRDSLAALPGLRGCLLELGVSGCPVPDVLDLGTDLLEELQAELATYLADKPPSTARDGNFIREGADERLDEQRSLRDGGKDALSAIETRERERTEIATLRVQHNRVFGYFIEIPKAHLSRTPSDYTRKQTLANAERFVTEELAGLESKVLGAQATALERELQLFERLRNSVSEAGERLCSVGERIACLDVLAGLAEVAQDQNYARPELSTRPWTDIEEGRHPVVERLLASGEFVPNDFSLRADCAGGVPRLAVITGPNMGGKSTVMRQVALISILAHVGSFVPARAAKIGLCDRIFTRVGAADDLGRGESTFMVEMRETAQILNQASPRSLVLLDEVGRGTATYDGLSLAWAITEHLHDQVGCQTLFATHYHELCGLAQRLPGVANLHVAVDERRGKIEFLHRVQEGPAGRSYGIQVGRLAGLPSRVLRRAGRILERFEAREGGGCAHDNQLDLFAPRVPPDGEDDETAGKALAQAGSGATPAMSAGEREVIERVSEMQLDEMTPRAAHAFLSELEAMLRH